MARRVFLDELDRVKFSLAFKHPSQVLLGCHILQTSTAYTHCSQIQRTLSHLLIAPNAMFTQHACSTCHTDTPCAYNNSMLSKAVWVLYSNDVLCYLNTFLQCHCRFLLSGYQMLMKDVLVRMRKVPQATRDALPPKSVRVMRVFELSSAMSSCPPDCLKYLPNKECMVCAADPSIDARPVRQCSLCLCAFHGRCQIG